MLVNLEANEEIAGKKYYVAYNTFMFHANAVTVIIGQLFMASFGAIGVVFLPYNLLNDWIFRPKPISKAEFSKRQKILLPKLLNLRKECKRLDADRMQVALMKGITGYWRRFQFSKKLRILETCTIVAEQEYQKLED
mmetsp:Transcript_21119/g.25993  ORF Transcript_21119/g.25993 Transcript_21119/m.25993 type:complete len:137 (-) Transcript_21119:829-1239(-)